MLDRNLEKENIFKEATRYSKFTENDLCTYSMYNNHQFELHQELIDELVLEGRLVKRHYDDREDTCYLYGKYANPEFIVVYMRNWLYGEPAMTDEEFVDSLLEIKVVK